MNHADNDCSKQAILTATAAHVALLSVYASLSPTGGQIETHRAEFDVNPTKHVHTLLRPLGGRVDPEYTFVLREAVVAPFSPHARAQLHPPRMGTPTLPPHTQRGYSWPTPWNNRHCHPGPIHTGSPPGAHPPSPCVVVTRSPTGEDTLDVPRAMGLSRVQNHTAEPQHAPHTMHDSAT
jgi:hypothetical protein